jgi:hypothetical protein
MCPFFGLSLNYRQYLHSHIFDLIYHGNGGFTWSDVYNMPVWARKFYINKIIEFKQEEKSANDKEAAKIRAKTRK